MQQKDNKMHPEDLRNLIVFGAISLILWFAYTHFVLDPQKEAMRAAHIAQQKTELAQQTQAGWVQEDVRPRAEVLGDTKSTRVSIENDHVMGSLNLTGARFDDLALKDYFKTVERIENSIVLYPKGTARPKYIEHGWVSPDKNLKLPTPKTTWKKVSGDVLKPDAPITLQWNNGKGVVFEQIISLDKDFLFTVQNRVINKTSAAVTVYPYSLIAQRDVPEEFMGRYIVHEGPLGYFQDELFEETYGKMKKNPLTVKTATQGWVGLTTKDWHTALIPAQGVEQKFRMVYTKGATDAVKDLYQTDITGAPMTAQAGGTIETTMNVFAGAKKLSLLNQYESQLNVPHFDLAVDFGILYFLTRPFFFMINFFYGFVGNFGIAIIMFTVLLRVAVFPLANTSFKSFANMRKIGPQMTELREKYKDDKQKMQQELVKLYQKEKVNPMAGCLPILVQIPIFFALFKVLSNTIEMRHAPFFGWIQDLSAPDPTSFTNLFGLMPWGTGPEFLHIGAWPIFMLITMIFQRKLSPPPADKLQAQMFAAMPWIMTIILAKFAAGLVIYWTFNNLFSTIQQYIIMRRMGVDVDIIGNIMGKKKAEPTPVDGAALDGDIIENQPSADDVVDSDKPVKVSKPKPKKSKKKK